MISLICGLEEETWAMQKVKKIWTHEVPSTKNDEHMKAHVLKKERKK